MTNAATPLYDRPIAENNPEEGIDRANLTALRNRFLSLNTQRLDRLRHSLLPQQRIFIDLLPLLLHINHPSLPGYAGSEVPAGIHNFRLSNQHIKSARKLSASFALQRELNTNRQLCGVYFMGSCSSITHNSRSDLDIWVCPEDGLSQKQLERLTRKCQLINEWAETLRLETHFFIMEAAAFKNGQRAALTEEDCGTTQHFLLLDEFYRTSIVMAGCTPLWWYVPASYDTDYTRYTQTLLDKRYLNAENCIDFGTPGAIPANEFVSAGIWQLYKGITNPEKSLLKLLLIEIYASEYPQTDNLSTQFKAAIYRADAGDNELDPYLQIYRRIEAYLLERGEHDRLELVRRCLYSKAGIALSRLPEDVDPATFVSNELAEPRQWKRVLMHKLVAEWGWRRDKLLELDNRKQWHFKQGKTEQTRLVKELFRSYQLLVSLVKTAQQSTDTPVIDKQARATLDVLGRQLHATFENKPGKLPQLTPSVVDSFVQQRIRFCIGNTASDDHLRDIWSMHGDAEEGALKKAQDPAALLAWGIINGLINQQTRFDIEEGHHQLTAHELKQLTQSLMPYLPVRNCINGQTLHPERFAQPARITDCLFVANCGLDPLQSHKVRDIWRITEKSDPLAYSALPENLVLSLTLIIVNSWGEVFCHSFAGANALNDCLQQYLGYTGSVNASDLPSHRFFCACPSKPAAIAGRLNKLVEDIHRCFNPTDDSDSTVANRHRSFVFESAFGFHVIRWPEAGPAITLYDTEASLLDSFNTPEGSGSLTLDASALQDHPLSAIVRTLEARRKSMLEKEAICLFYEVDGDTAHVYLADTSGALAYTPLPYESMRALIMPIKKFVEQSESRRASTQQLGPAGTNLEQLAAGHDLACFVLQKNLDRYSVNQVPTESDIQTNYLSIKAIGQKTTAEQLCWTISCDNQLYSESELGNALYTEVASAILRLRQPSQNRYRCYITDIEIEGSSSSDHSVLSDFIHKNALEKKLNQAYLNLD